MSTDLKIIIPVAGVGTRLRPHTYTIPKPLIPVAGKPMLAHVLDPLAALDPGEVRFVVGHLGGQIVDYVRENYDFNSTFVEQTDLLGLGFAVNLALEEMNPAPTMIVLGDTIAHTDFHRFISTADNVIGVKKVDDPRRFGIAVVDDSRVTGFEEKPEEPHSDLAIIGLYYFREPSVLKYNLERLIESGRKTKGEIQLTDALDLMLQDGQEFHISVVEGWYDCGKKETLLSTNRALLEIDGGSSDHPGSVIIPPVNIHPSAKIRESVVGPFVSVSERVNISRSVIRDAIICNDAVIEDSLLEKSIVGRYARVLGKSRILNIGDSTEA
jgi:glucose-1-phosphate thymidylyltransferase